MKKAREKIEMICGKTLNEIREAYFNNCLTKLLNDIQAENIYKEEEIEKLADYLESLKKENGLVLSKVKEKIGELDIDSTSKPPSVEELTQGISDKEWRDNADKAYNYVNNKLDEIRQMIKDKKRPEYGFWSDQAMIFLSYDNILSMDLIYKEQLFKARLTNIIDKNGTSRKEAEERATMTKEFSDYKKLRRLFERLEEFYTFARRYDDKQNNK